MSKDKNKTKEAPAKVAHYKVAEGKSLTTRKGIKGPGERISGADLPGGVTALDALIDGGYVEKSGK